eukprot:5645706-Lingulodinium_polyedra.AAC.1
MRAKSEVVSPPPTRRNWHQAGAKKEGPPPHPEGPRGPGTPPYPSGGGGVQESEFQRMKKSL